MSVEEWAAQVIANDEEYGRDNPDNPNNKPKGK